MKRTVFPGLVMMACLVTASVSLAADFRVNSAALSEIQLQMPDSAAEKKYLGISGTGTFSLPQIRADLILVEIFSMYCPICQAEAPNVNKVHELIESDSDLKARVRLVGIGTGNTPFEVDVFKKKYDIKFPLFSDDSFRVQKASSTPIRTPTFLALERADGKRITVKRVHVGAISDVAAFVKEMMGTK